MAYLFYVLSVILFVFIVPALSIFPKLITSPIGLASIPMMSSVVIYIVTSSLLLTGCFNSLSVPLVCIGMVLIAMVRLRHTSIVKLSALQRGWICFSLIVCLPYAAKLGTTGFDSSDELYSWNVWALQYFHGWVYPDFYNVTVSPYPQLFPKVVAFAYHLLGSTELQLPLKAALTIIPFSFVSLLSLICPSPNTTVARLLLILGVVFGANLQRYFSYAYADPLMSACLLSSIAYYWSWRQSPHTQSLILSVVFALGAAYTKQPGLIWSLFSLPVLLVLHRHSQYKQQIMTAVCVLVTGSLFWILGQGAGFENNGGVLNASYENRSHGEQIWFSIKNNLIFNPVVGGLALLTAWKAISYPLVRPLVIFWLFPSTVAWLVFGAYDLRLGMHNVLGMAFVLIVAQLPTWKIRWRHVTMSKGLAIASILSIMGTGQVITKSLLYKEGLSPYHSGQVTISKYFGDESMKIYHELYNQSHLILWTPTDYITGLFYMKANVFRPRWERFDAYNNEPVTAFSKQLLIRELIETGADFAFTGGRVANRGSIASRSLEALAVEYPDVFIAYAKPPNRYGYHTYEVDKEGLKSLASVSLAG